MGMTNLTILVQWYQQPARCSKICFIDSFRLALHVSGDSFVHLQEHFDCRYILTKTFHEQGSQIKVLLIIILSCRTLFQKAVYTKCSWKWEKLSPETWRASLKESIKQIWLHLVGCWYHCNSDARSHKRQVRKLRYHGTSCLIASLFAALHL